MKYLLALLAAKALVSVLALTAFTLGLAALLNLFEINSIFKSWFDASFFLPALAGLSVWAAHFIARLLTDHFLDRQHDEDAAG